MEISKNFKNIQLKYKYTMYWGFIFIKGIEDFL